MKDVFIINVNALNCNVQFYLHYMIMIMIITNDYHVVFLLKQAYSISIKNDLDRGLQCL